MRIALLSYRGNMYCGGQGVYIYYLSKALAELGHEVSILVGPPYPADMPWAKVYKIHNENFINKQKDFIPSHNPLSIFHPLNFLEFGLSRLGPNPEMLAFSIRAFMLFRKLHKQKPFDIVHDNQGLGYGLYLIRSLGVPVVATIHHPLQIDRKEDLLQSKGIIQKARRALYYPLLMQAYVARRLSRIITVSNFSRKLVSETYRLDDSLIHTVYNGVDHKIFSPFPSLKRQHHRILFVGSSEDRKKGIKYLLLAMKELSLPSIRLIIVDGRLYPGRTYSKNLVKELGLSERVIFREKITRDELVSEYKLAEALVMPSLFEGFGLPALEAMACGTPIIATTAGAIPEVTGPSGESAILVPPADELALAKAIKNLLDNYSLKQKLSKQAINRAVALFSWNKAASNIEKIYQKCKLGVRASHLT